MKQRERKVPVRRVTEGEESTCPPGIVQSDHKCDCHAAITSLFYVVVLPMSVAAQSKARVLGRSIPGIAVSKPAGGMYVCLL
jgi:hypothetical protein